MITTRQILQRSALMAIGLLAITGSPALAQNYVFSDMGDQQSFKTVWPTGYQQSGPGSSR